MALSPAAAARRSGISRSGISRALTNGDLKGVRKVSGHWSIDESDLDEWLATTTQRARADEADEVAHLRAELQRVTAERDRLQGRSIVGIVRRLFRR